MTDTSPKGSPPDSLSTTTQPVRVTWAELPLSCPRPGNPLWSLHPRVYLPIHETGMEQCPYCSTVYVLDKADPADPLFPNIRIERRHDRAVEHTRQEVDRTRDELKAGG